VCACRMCSYTAEIAFWGHTILHTHTVIWRTVLFTYHTAYRSLVFASRLYHASCTQSGFTLDWARVSPSVISATCLNGVGLWRFGKSAKRSNPRPTQPSRMKNSLRLKCRNIRWVHVNALVKFRVDTMETECMHWAQRDRHDTPHSV
jgi:hypothetical protein